VVHHDDKSVAFCVRDDVRLLRPGHHPDVGASSPLHALDQVIHHRSAADRVGLLGAAERLEADRVASGGKDAYESWRRSKRGGRAHIRGEPIDSR
jgi:hypothetical protein